MLRALMKPYLNDSQGCPVVVTLSVYEHKSPRIGISRPPSPEIPFSTPNLQVCRFYFLNLAQKEKPLLRKPDPPYKGVKVLEIRGESSFCPEQVLLTNSTNFHSRAGCRQIILSKEVWGWGWGENLILSVGKTLQECHAKRVVLF